jgi:hypothetical protein
MIYVRLTKAEKAALVELAGVNRRHVADEAGYAVTEDLQRNAVAPEPATSPITPPKADEASWRKAVRDVA